MQEKSGDITEIDMNIWIGPAGLLRASARTKLTLTGLYPAFA
jgi:hypothetical protein